MAAFKKNDVCLQPHHLFWGQWKDVCSCNWSAVLFGDMGSKDFLCDLEKPLASSFPHFHSVDGLQTVFLTKVYYCFLKDSFFFFLSFPKIQLDCLRSNVHQKAFWGSGFISSFWWENNRQRDLNQTLDIFCLKMQISLPLYFTKEFERFYFYTN